MGRRNEVQRTWFRSERIFRFNSDWYFHTQEGVDVGPFKTEFEAQVEASILKKMLREQPPELALERIREFVLDARTSLWDLRAFTGYDVKERRS
jgi:hypothetical protein